MIQLFFLFVFDLLHNINGLLDINKLIYVFEDN